MIVRKGFLRWYARDGAGREYGPFLTEKRAKAFEDYARTGGGQFVFSNVGKISITGQTLNGKRLPDWTE